MRFEFTPIAIIHTPFTQRFGIPRQPGLVPEAKGVIKFDKNPDFIHALKGMEQFTHLWVVFVFHSHGGNKWKPTIRPPRLGGKEKMGVLASRSPHRPNPIGLSVVEIERIDLEAKGGAEIHVKGVDLLDGTPILDVKPYIPYADSVPGADPGWAHEEIKKTRVIFEDAALQKVVDAESGGEKNLKALIEQLLTIDPRPGFQRRELPPDAEHSQGKDFGLLVKKWDVHWKIENQAFVVTDLVRVPGRTGSQRKSKKASID
ncbi:MAG: tRNA (N6-threonylcarbamoyladenosine(37)-N6)-methyltransferase TrmO [Proteobacteria bacterium]|nr:tRNA (N6-threonylcarbamoyladenosine(37)-N6)-methyltransferase TrmO [Pseudomonadota bacterium]